MLIDPEAGENKAIDWTRLDDLRRDRRFPTVRFFEVRSMDDPGYADAPVSFGHGMPVEKSRGFKNARDAARRAWKLWQGEKTRTGQPQGDGGWFFWHSGRAVCQGLDDLAVFCQGRGLVELGVDGRYYPMVSKLDD